MQSRLNPERERALVKKARQDPTAFRELYSHYFPRIYAYVSYRIGRVQDVEDLVADTFLRVVERLDEFQWRGEGSFAAWLFRIAHNLVSDFYRRGRGLEESVPLEELPELKASTLLPANAVLQKEKFAYLRRLIGTLSSRRQEVITLKFFGGLRNKEIAALLKLDERTTTIITFYLAPTWRCKPLGWGFFSGSNLQLVHLSSNFTSATSSPNWALPAAPRPWPWPCNTIFRPFGELGTPQAQDEPGHLTR